MIVKKLPFSEFKSIYSRVPRLCVEIMVKTNNGVLLLKRNIDPEKGKWHLPGGTVLKGERLEDTVKRVAMEEIGVKVKVGEVLDIIEYFIKGYFGQMVGIIFSVEPISKNFKIDKNTQEFRFFKIIPKNTIKQHKKLLNKKFGLKIEYINA
ncbi:NUDIX hydrolase [Patescibacteria group bacterium]|nr:NUDIX hydrolase [Patescibacteria group bacterium]